MLEIERRVVANIHDDIAHLQATVRRRRDFIYLKYIFFCTQNRRVSKLKIVIASLYTFKMESGTLYSAPPFNLKPHGTDILSRERTTCIFFSCVGLCAAIFATSPFGVLYLLVFYLLVNKYI